MFLLKLKRLVFISLGILLILSIISTAVFLVCMMPIPLYAKILMLILLTALGLAIFMIVPMLFFSDGKITPFIISFVHIFEDMKWICHSDLGYFIASFERNGDIIIYKQGFLHVKEIFTFNGNGYGEGDALTKVVADIIKSNLDSIYRERIRKENEYKEHRKKVDSLKKWDGYLDVQGRRDGKIKDLLK